MFYLICVLIVATCSNVVLAVEYSVSHNDYYQYQNLNRPVGRAYSLSSCDYRTQVGYSCLTCHRALHCYPGNAAILVDCYGVFRFCRDGRCSRFQGEKCLTDSKVTTPSSFNSTSTDFTDSLGPTGTEATARDDAVTEHLSTTVTKNDVTVTNSEVENVDITDADVDVVDVQSPTVTESITSEKETVASTNAGTVTETVIIPIDETATTNSDTNSTSSVDISSNVVY